jgi:hypothetical protein
MTTKLNTNSGTLEYGNIIKIVSSNTSYEGKFFFVDRLYDDKLVLLSDKETITLGITDQELDDETIEKIIIVYKARKGHYIFQNKLFVSQRIEIEFEDMKVIGKITNINYTDQIIDVETTEGTLYIPLHRGLPKEIVSIKAIHIKEKEPETDELEIDDGILNIIEEDVEEDEFYYSIEQQKNDFLENLLMYIPVKERTPKKLKELNKMIQRYVELRTKYTTFTDGVYINHLQIEQIFATTVALENKLYIPVTKGIHVKLSPYTKKESDEDEEERPDVKENFFKEARDDWMKEYSDLKENIPFHKIIELNNNFDNLIYQSKTSANQLKYIPESNKDSTKKSTLAHIAATNEYPFMISKPFVIDSLIGQPKFFIDYAKVNLHRSFVMEKSTLSLSPYYPSIYNLSSGKFCDNHRVIYKNKEDTFDKYIKKLIPSMNDFIECVNKPFINMIDVLNALNVLNINELNATNYLLVNDLIKKNVYKIKQNFIKTRPSYLTKGNRDSIVENQTVLDVLKEYENLSKLPELKRHYSTSEIFKMAEVDLHKLLTFEYSVRNSVLNQTTDGEIQAIIDEIKEEKDKPLEKQINKFYETKEEMDRDNFKPIIIRDVETEPGSGVYMSTLEILHSELVQDESTKTTKSYEHFNDQINGIINLGMKFNKSGLTPTAIKTIKEFIIKNKIVKGDIALLNGKKYEWNEKWVDYIPGSTSKKLVTVKGDMTEGLAQKEEMYNKRILDLVTNIEKDKMKVAELRDFYNEENKKDLKNMLKTLVKKNILQGLKYNNDKLLLEKKEIGEKTGVVESPHEHTRDKILQVYELDIKYKAIQLFIERYCKKGSDKYWYYCIDTGVKLIPSFFNKLAAAYLITHDYENVLEEICLDQGSISDSGDKWVDKNSGYIIKNIEFDYDEGYTETGFKNITRSVIEKPEMTVREEDPIMNSIKALIRYAGLTDIGDDIEWVYTHVMQSHQKALRNIKKSRAEGARPMSEEALYVIGIISVVLVYAQTLERIPFIKSFPNCKASFRGFPLDETSTSGIKYFCCIVSKMEKPDLPFSSVRKIKVEDLEKSVEDFIKRILLTNVEIEEKLNERKLHLVEEDISRYTPWTLFLPRLKPFRPSVYQDIGQSNEDKIYFISFLIQYKINQFVSKQPPILINHNQLPYLVNTCCNEDNDTYHYFTTKIPSIVDDLKEIKKLTDLTKTKQALLRHPVVYSYMNTKKVSIPIATDLEETTLFRGLIKLLNFDNALPIPITLTKFGIEKPQYYNKNDDIQLKITKLKEHGYEITEKMLYEMLQNSATRVNDTVKQSVLPPEIDDPIMAFLDTKDMKNKTYELMNKKRLACDKYGPDYSLLLSVNFKDEKRSSTVSVEIEHFTYIYQVLYNKIQSLINFSVMIASRKSNQLDVTCAHWKLSEYHYGDIRDFVNSYYTSIQGFFANQELARALERFPLDKYKEMLNIPIKDPETKYLVYHYIFVSIYELYLSSKSKVIKEYLDAVTALFNHENKRSLNFDLKSIKYDIKISKKSEAEIKKTYFSKLGSDELVSENTMKNLKLGKWGIGLQKSMFEYDKDTYLKDKLAAEDVVQLIGDPEADTENALPQQEVDEYAAFMPEDDDYEDGFDGDELY